MRFRIDITRREGLSDPEGVTTERALGDLGYDAEHVSFGRSITLDVPGDDEARLLDLVDEMCRRLLANPVIEDYEISMVKT